MDHSITFRNGDESYNTFDDWHLIAPTRPSIAPAQPKSNYVDILGANGSLDFSEALVGNPTYSDREGSWEFVVLNPGDVDQYSLFDAEDRGRYRWQKIYDKIQAAIHGRSFEVILDDDPERMYKGRLWMNEWRSNAGWSRIVINYRLRPYKYDLEGNIVWPEYAVGYDEDDDRIELVFIEQPEDAEILAGNEASFRAIVAGTDRTMVWQTLGSDGETWVNVPLNDGTYSVIETTLGDASTTSILFVSTQPQSSSSGLSGYRLYFRCAAYDIYDNSIISDTARLDVNFSSGSVEIDFTSSDRTIRVGEATSFFVTAHTSNEGATLSYQWQEMTGTVGWRDIGDTFTYSGAQTNYLTVTTVDQDGNPDEYSVYYPGGCKYRCIVTDSTGAQAISDSRSLTVVIAPRVSISPLSNSAQGEVGDVSTVNIYATASGGSGTLSYVWEHDYSGSWTRFASSGSVVTSDNDISSSIAIKINHQTEGTSGFNVRCTVTDSNGAFATTDSSSYIQIKTNDDAVRFVTQPSDATARAGGSATFSAVVSGNVAVYAWQYKAPGASVWSEASTWAKASGAKTSSMTVSGLATSDSGTLVRLRVSTSPDYSVLYSDTVELTVTYRLPIS